MPQEETKKAGGVQSRGRPGDMVGSGGQGLAMLEAAKVGRTGPKDRKFLVSPLTSSGPSLSPPLFPVDESTKAPTSKLICSPNCFSPLYCD